ncbi:MAG: tRNA guanosine(34) transglycosylase Tgt, partial [Firmicutes bacterium]|nr:tRNA guanosine(34) transglycosylase Tgt [Bacillota bacterium]
MRFILEAGGDGPCRPRAGILETAHGPVLTPVFMPVGTQGSVKGVSPRDLRELGAQIILANTYHLHLRPGEDLVREAGGLHAFMGWDGPILTDSGGYQVFSLADLRHISEEGVAFKSFLDGSDHLFTPETVIDIQLALGADLLMAFDECPPYPCERNAARAAMERTHRWAARCKARWLERSSSAALFGIVQGSVYPELRAESARAIADLDLPGNAIGGVSVGEPKELMEEVVAHTTPLLPEEKPRYLMGVGTPEDLLVAVGFGIDMFDCVLPTRTARTGSALTWEGRLNLRNAIHARDPRPLDESCDCP